MKNITTAKLTKSYEYWKTFFLSKRLVTSSEVIGQELDYDPSEGQDWKWEEYE